MDPQERKEGIAPVKDRLVTTLFLAALFHGIVILGVSFGVLGLPGPDAAPTLEVLLVDDRMPEAPKNPDADYLAQRSQQGSGNTREGRTSNPTASQLAMDNPGTADGQSLADQVPAHRSAAASVLSAPAARGLQAGDAAETNGGAQQKSLLMHSGPASPLPSADEGQQLVLRGMTREGLLITPNTREADVSVYADHWVQKVERVGTLNFPSEMRRRGKSGNPLVEVTIGTGGQLMNAVVVRSSGHPELDQAAMDILRLATPFDPFPAELRERYRFLQFKYEWQFLGGKLVGTAVRSR